MIVTAAIIQVKERYLICQRGKEDPLSLMWEFPGGKLEFGETPEDGLVREIKEELKLDIEIIDHFCDAVYEYATSKIVLKAYIANIIGGNMELIVHNAAEWVEAECLLNYTLLPADIEIAKKLLSR